jgi:HNH endonuclease
MLPEELWTKFFRLVAPPNERGCQLWMGGRRGNKNHRNNIYGCFAWVRDNYRRVEQAHRIMFSIVHGPIPDGYVVMHKCDVPLCVNPDHLESGTQQQNIADRDRKGRTAPLRGEAAPWAKITEAEARELIRAYATGEFLQQELADRYGLGLTQVNRIITGKRWAHLHQEAASR